MTEYLITDAITGEKTWVAAESVRDALIRRENELRAAGGPGRSRKPPLPLNSKASHYSSGSIVDVSIADVSCVGQRRAVVREPEMTEPSA